MRYLGTGGTGVADDSNAVPSEHFTFSTMVLPPGCEGPPHVHDDVEEVFFMLRGKIRLTLESGGETFETELGERDLISVPPGVLSRPRQRGRGGGADVRDAGRRETAHPDLPARPSFGEDRALGLRRGASAA